MAFNEAQRWAPEQVYSTMTGIAASESREEVELRQGPKRNDPGYLVHQRAEDKRHHTGGCCFLPP